jgi:hypothetical protein
MAGFTASEVFMDIDEIAHSGDLVRERQARAELRVDEFEFDLAKQRLQPGVPEKIKGDLQRKLEGVVRNRDVIADVDIVFRAAFDKLTGEQG